MKTKLTPKLAVALLSLSTLSSQVSIALAQGTAFTYQGRLNDSGSPANGSYDLRFILYTSDVGGNQVGPTLTNTPTLVSEGYFTVVLDFGVGAFPGPGGRWLDIAVRTNGTDPFTPLSLRQKVTATPFAITAGSISGVLPSSGLSGTYSGGVIFSDPFNFFTGNGSGLTSLNGANISSGTVGSAQLGANSVSSANIVDGTIANADISASAAIADTKLATIATAGKVSDSALSANITKLDTAQTFGADKTLGAGSQLFADSGAATAPGVTFNGDGDTGVYHPSANTVAFATGGAERVRITSVGSLAIGTTSPSRELEVQHAGDTEIGVKSTDTGGHLWTIQSTSVSGSDSRDGSFQVIDRTANAARMLIDTNGNMGIGTSGPAVRLNVAGGTDASLSGGGFIMAGSLSGANVAIDNNEILARNNGAASTLYLNVTYPSSGSCLVNPGIVVGGNVVPTVDGEQFLGDCNAAWRDVRSHGFDTVSDARLKDSIEPLQYGLQTILSLRPVSFKWKNGNDGVNLGLIAQEVEPVVPEAVTVGDNADQTLALRYNAFIPILMKAVQEQQALIDEQRAENAELKRRLDKLERMVSALGGGN